MILPQKVFWFGLGTLAWLFVVSPAISQEIHRTSLEGPAPFSVSTVRAKLADGDDTGSPEVDEEMQTLLAELAGLELAENERVTALWGLVDDETRALAEQQVEAVPPLTYAVDPRFFDPLTPSIIQRTIEAYGFALEPLPRSSVGQRGEQGNQRKQLMTVLSLIHHDLLSSEQAAMTLQGAMEILDLQTKRKTIEEQLRARFEESEQDL